MPPVLTLTGSRGSADVGSHANCMYKTSSSMCSTVLMNPAAKKLALVTLPAERIDDVNP